jgi:hypothetical protein
MLFPAEFLSEIVESSSICEKIEKPKDGFGTDLDRFRFFFEQEFHGIGKVKYPCVKSGLDIISVLLQDAHSVRVFQLFLEFLECYFLFFAVMKGVDMMNRIVG